MRQSPCIIIFSSLCINVGGRVVEVLESLESSKGVGSNPGSDKYIFFVEHSPVVSLCAKKRNCTIRPMKNNEIKWV